MKVIYVNLGAVGLIRVKDNPEEGEFCVWNGYVCVGGDFDGRLKICFEICFAPNGFVEDCVVVYRVCVRGKDSWRKILVPEINYQR